MDEDRGDGESGPRGLPRSAGAASLSPVEESVFLSAMRQIQVLADFAADAELWQHTAEQSVAAVRESAVAVRKVQSAHLATVADLDFRKSALAGTAAGYGARTFLRGHLKRTTSQAKADIAAARALRPGASPVDGGMPRLAKALAAGEVSREHVDAALRVVGRLPKKVLVAPMRDENGDPLLDEQGDAMTGGDVLDERITEHAKAYDSRALANLAAQLQDVIDPDGKFDPESCLKRGLRLRWDSEGMLLLRGELDPASGALFMAVIDQVATPRHRDKAALRRADDAPGKVRDERDGAQRNADALMDILRAAQASGSLGSRGGDSPRITLITTPEDLAAANAAAGAGCCSSAAGSHAPSERRDHRRDACGHDPDPGDGAEIGTGTRVTPSLLARFACDAVLQRALLAPNGAILDLGREERTVTAAQRRALHARDRGCVIPGCTVPAAWTEGHHVRWWSDGGPTDIGNLALLCGRHHTEVHAGTWRLLMENGVPWAIPPDWLDRDRTPMRNTYHQHLQDMRDLGIQLRINLGPPGRGAA